MSLLRGLFESRALAPALPFGEQLAAVHIPFDDLVGGSARETRVATVTDGGGLVIVIGGTGEGKSGLVSAALSITTGRLAVPVPVSVPHPEGATAAQIPGLVLDGMANVLSTFDEAARTQAQVAASGVIPSSWVSGALDIKGVQLNVGDLLRGHRTLVLNEQIDAIHQAAAACRKGGLSPVLVLDDTDKWSRTADRIRAGRAFFDDALDAIVQLGLPVVANAHPKYFERTSDIPDKFDARVLVPRVDAPGLRRILARRIEVATEGAATLDAAFEPAAVDRVAAEYGVATVPIRRIVQISNEAVIEAVEAAAARRIPNVSSSRWTSENRRSGPLLTSARRSALGRVTGRSPEDHECLLGLRVHREPAPVRRRVEHGLAWASISAHTSGVGRRPKWGTEPALVRAPTRGTRLRGTPNSAST